MEEKFDYIFEEIESIEEVPNEGQYVYDIEVEDESHTFIAGDILVHNSVYTTYGGLFACFTPEYKELYDTDRKKTEWILNFNTKFLDGQNFQWMNEIYEPRFARNIHNFELETISRAQINLKKKKYIKALVFSKGRFFDKPKMSGVGIEVIKSTTPKLCRKILTDLIEDLMFNSAKMSKDEYVYYFNDRLTAYKKEFYAAPIEDISESVGIGAYKKYIVDDKDEFKFKKKCPVSVKAIGLFNYLAHKNKCDNLHTISGKIKYYNIRLGENESAYFGYPAGQLPEWAPKIDKKTQWVKTIINPINRFLEVMGYPLANGENIIQLNLFGFDNNNIDNDEEEEEIIE